MLNPSRSNVWTSIFAVGILALSPACADGAGHVEAPTPETIPESAPDSAPPTRPAAKPSTSRPQIPTDPIAATNALFASILSDVVDDDGLVSYERLATERHRTALHTTIDGYARATLPTSGPARFALWSNAYNANVLRMALEAQASAGFTSVKDVPGFFDRAEIIVAGERMTLNGLENDHVRKLGDARAHAALVCAAMSCPPLRNEPYDAARLDEQLDDQSSRWVNDPKKFTASRGTLGMSRILEWYGADFEGKPYGGAVGFVRKYAKPSSAVGRLFASSPSPSTNWGEYDWALNRSKR